MKKKIFFILSTNEYSGAEAVTINIINELKDIFDFYYVSIKGPIVNYLTENNIKWIEIESLTKREIKRIVKEYKPDLIHAVNYRVSTLCALSNIKTPFICHLHNNAPWIKHISLKTIIFLYAGLKARKILTVSDSVEKEFIFANKLKGKFINVHNPVSTLNVLSKIDENNLDKKYDVCCVARITELKNPILFVDIIAQLKKKNKTIKAIWVGDGDLKQDIIKYCHDNSLDKNIEFVGFKKNPYQYMAQSKIFLLTSKWEGYGLVAFEALTLGLPCVVSDVGGLKEIVDNKCGRLCNTANMNEYLDETFRLLEDEKYYIQKHKAAIEKSLKIENIVEYMSYIKKIYNDIILY